MLDMAAIKAGWRPVQIVQKRLLWPRFERLSTNGVEDFPSSYKQPFTLSLSKVAVAQGCSRGRLLARWEGWATYACAQRTLPD